MQCACKPQFVLWFIKRQNFLFSTFYEKPRRGIKTSHTVCGKHQGLNSVGVRTDLRYTYANHNRDPDLPTSKTCKSGDVEKKPRKTWRLGPQTWRFPKHVLNENKNGRFLVSRYSLPYLCTYCILLPHILKSQFLFRCRREAPG